MLLKTCFLCLNLTKIKKMSFYDLFAQLFNLNYIRYSSLILKGIVLFMKICAF